MGRKEVIVEESHPRMIGRTGFGIRGSLLLFRAFGGHLSEVLKPTGTDDGTRYESEGEESNWILG